MLTLRRIDLPDVEALVKANGDDHLGHFDSKSEFLSQELGDYSDQGVIEVLLITRWQYGRCGVTPTLRYTARFATTDYETFQPKFLKREQHPIKEDPLPDKVPITKPKAGQD